MNRTMIRWLLIASLLSAVTVELHAEQGECYVTAPVLNERASPGNGKVLNRIYRGQKVTVYEVRDGWARVTPPNRQARWVVMEHLSATKPETPKGDAIPDAWKNPRIDAEGMPKVGESNLTQKDVEILWRGANMMLRKGRCSKVEYADKSVSKANTYFVSCGGRNQFFTEADLYE